MAAIYGIHGHTDLAQLRAMGERIRHRGTQGGEWSLSDRVHFGFRIHAPNQGPYRAADVPILFDGFLDNRNELDMLLGRQPGCNGADQDASTVFELFRKFGPDGFQYLSGHFAAVIWDARTRRLILARDRYGARPLYYAKVGERLLFASEYKALLAIDEVPARPNRDAIQYVQCTKRMVPDATCLLDVHPVVPGHWLAVTDNDLQNHRFWDLQVKITERTEAQHAAVLRETVLESARRQCARYDTIGVSLSGGLDSAVTVAAIHHVAPEKKLHTFTAGFGPDDREIVDAAEVARHFGTEHHEIILDPEELPLLMRPIVWHLEDPVGCEEIAFLFVTSREATKYVKILMTGLGADMLFGGMPRHLVVQTAFRFPALRKTLQEFLQYSVAGLPPRTLLGKLLTFAYHKGKTYPWPRVTGADKLPQCDDLCPSGSEPFSDYLRYYLIEKFLETKTESLHSAFGLSYNAPCMDLKVVDCAFHIPDRLKINGIKQKYIFRRAFQGLLPATMLNRKKTFQKLRHDLKFSNILDHLAEEYLSREAVAARGLFQQKYVDRLMRRPANRAYPTEQAFRIWSLLLTEVWARQFLDQRGRRPSQSW